MTFRAISLALLLVSACGESDPPPSSTGNDARCAQCGMRVDVAPQWRAGLGDDVLFDSPKCLFRWAAREGRGTETAWFTEYYSSERKPLVDLVFVVGSDVLSPMGDDLVPIEGAVRAELFVRDHGGRIVTPGRVDAVLLRSLDAP